MFCNLPRNFVLVAIWTNLCGVGCKTVFCFLRVFFLLKQKQLLERQKVIGTYKGQIRTIQPGGEAFFDIVCFICGFQFFGKSIVFVWYFLQQTSSSVEDIMCLQFLRSKNLSCWQQTFIPCSCDSGAVITSPIACPIVRNNFRFHDSVCVYVRVCVRAGSRFVLLCPGTR